LIKAPFIRPVLLFMQRITLRLFADLRVTGLENVPRTGSLLIVANHQSNFDPPLLAAILPRKVWFLAKREVFINGLARWFLLSSGVHPVNRQSVDAGAYRWIISRLQAGEAVIMFPEGTRNRGGMGAGMAGVAQIALRTGTPVLPVGIEGTAHLGTYLRVFNPTGKLRVNIGKPFTLTAGDGKADKEAVQQHLETIMYRIAALVPPELRGEYAIDHAPQSAASHGHDQSLSVVTPSTSSGQALSEAERRHHCHPFGRL
jgi:1-acyl-sn-glycerol-3-phosphate acyltransferase